MSDKNITAEQRRINENNEKEIPLEKWGPYLSERQWGTVREDYSASGDAWNYLSHDQARSRVYRWGEDGLAGISDYMQNLCFSVALWNGKDTILKERLFGLSNGQGNHGEDVKELYYYLDNTPTHYYMKYLYKYPQQAFPYQDIINRNRSLSKQEPEYEILDTGVFKDNKYFDVFVEYAKNSSEDIFIKIDIVNRGADAAPITVLPTLWFRNRWQFDNATPKPSIEWVSNTELKTTHEPIGEHHLYFKGAGQILITENETNTERVLGRTNVTPYVKDAFHDSVISGKNTDALIKKKEGTKVAPVYRLTIDGGGSKQIYLRLTNTASDTPFAEGFESIFDLRKKEADEFYASVIAPNTSADLANIQRQAFAGLLWSKQYYHYDVEKWMSTSDGVTPLSPERLQGRNHDWKYLKNQDVILMPDKWEYPWYAAWDTAFHCIAIAPIDPTFAKGQLILLMREWYMNPYGQIPAYEWNFSDVNPPVHAFAALGVYRAEKDTTGKGDIQFLKRIFQKLIINFTWWVNRKDANGNNIFEGGFLGLDNIGVFNRSIQLPDQIALEQADGTSWMGMYALNMLDIALEIALTDDAFEDTATKFYEHFVLIADALNELNLWNSEDNFFYDVLCLKGKLPVALKVRSIVGVAPVFAVSIINKNSMDKLSDFAKRTAWFDKYRIYNNDYLPNQKRADSDDSLLSLVPKERLIQILDKLLDESEFLSKGGIRALSKYHDKNPYTITIQGVNYSIEYDPGDSTSDFFGGNSNWRGPVWLPINYLIIKAIKKYGEYYKDTLKVECPRNSGIMLNLEDVAAELTKRILSIFERDDKGHRPLYDNFNANYNEFYSLPENKDLVLFHEYFHGDNGSGLGASHQTGWTALVANLIGTA
jgi:hypothetical protein